MNNFSNYSSWYYRSKLLQKLYPSNVHDLPIKSDKHDEGNNTKFIIPIICKFLTPASKLKFLILELDLVMNATFTDPNDSSAWFYHRWLLDFTKPQYTLWQAVLTNNRVTAVFHNEVSSNLELYLNSEKIDCVWESVNRQNYSSIWSASLEKILSDNCNEVWLKFGEAVYRMKQSDSKDQWIYKSQILEQNHNISKLKEQLENYQQLSVMEPKNKWAKLTSYYLMLRINPIEKHADIIKILNELMGLDPLRINYYKDTRK